MNKRLIKQIQGKIIKLLKQKDKPLYLLAEDNCSELSRLVGCWLLEKELCLKVFIMKGRGVMNIKNKCHDILLIEDRGQSYLIDPTIWQFFKNKRSILIGEAKNDKNPSDVLKDTYKGKWGAPERLTKKDCSQKEKWIKIIKQNIAEL